MKSIIYSLIFVLGLSTATSCRPHLCPTYATSRPTKRKKTRRPKKNAPWHKPGKMKKGKGRPGSVGPK